MSNGVQGYSVLERNRYRSRTFTPSGQNGSRPMRSSTSATGANSPRTISSTYKRNGASRTRRYTMLCTMVASSESASTASPLTTSAMSSQRPARPRQLLWPRPARLSVSMLWTIKPTAPPRVRAAGATRCRSRAYSDSDRLDTLRHRLQSLQSSGTLIGLSFQRVRGIFIANGRQSLIFGPREAAKRR